MMEEDRMEIFLGSMDPGNSEFLEMLGEEALRASVPIIRRQTQSALRVLLAALRPEKILEIGCAVGFSAILMCENCNARITTIENYEKRIAPARENFRRAGVEDRVELLFGDAAEILPKLTETYDFIFMDAAKGQYIHFLPEVIRLLRPGGMLVVRAECLSRTMSCRTGIFWNLILPSSGGTARSINACGNIYMN